MKRYGDPVQVHTAAPSGTGRPDQFLWRGQLWKVREVLGRWVETAEWWRSEGAQEARGTDRPTHASRGPGTSVITSPGHVLESLLDERQVWRVEAGRPVATRGAERGWESGVFELVRDPGADAWQLVGCND